MNTKQFFGYGLLAVILALTFTALSLTSCEQPIDSPTVAILTSITANYTGTAAVYPTTQLDSLKSGLTVTALYSNGASKTLTQTEYTLSGTLSVGTSTVTVIHAGKTTTFTVTVTAAPSGSAITYTAIQTGGTDSTADTTAINFTFSAAVSGLTANDITVTNGTGAVTKGALSGSGTSWSLAVTVTTPGNVTVSINKSGIEAETKHITVYKTGQSVPTLTGITLNTVSVKQAYIQNETLNLSGLVVTANYSGSSSVTVTGYTSNPTNGATLTATGQITVTVSYTEGAITQTASFIVNVTGGSVPGGNGKLTINNFPSDASLVIGVYDYDGEITILQDIVNVQLETQKLLGGSLGMVSASPASLIRATSTSAFNGTGTYLVLLADASALQTWYAPQVAFTNGCAELDFNTLGLVSELPITAGEFVAVTGITGVPATATVGTPLTLNGTVEPATATNKTISWSVVSGPAAISGQTLNFTAAGAVTVKATITNGTAPGTDYTENFTITVSGGGTPGLAYELITTGTNANTYRVRKGTVTSGEVIIPATYNGLPVTEIGKIGEGWQNGAFYSTSITSVQIPESVTSIGNFAFYNCGSLASIEIPVSVTSIDNGAFQDCTILSSIIIPAGVTTVINYPFYDWTSSQTIYVAGHTSQAAADAAWGTEWRSYCNANIVYGRSSGIEIIRQPDKTVYVIGEPLDITGLVVTVINNNGSTETVTLTTAHITGFNSSAKGVQTLTVTYEGRTATFTVTVFDATITYTVTNTSEWNTALTNISNGGSYQDRIINVSGNIAVPGSTADSFGTVSGLNVTLQGNGKLSLNSNGSMIRIAANQTLIIDSANLIMEGRDSNNAALAYVAGINARLELRNGTISNNYRNTTTNELGSGVQVMNNGTFTMSGGTISDNTVYHTNGGAGGGVCVGGMIDYSRTPGTFIMSGGTISNNTATGFYGGSGGGVFVLNGTFTMSGGTISDNTASGYGSCNGGGVSTEGDFNMLGGTISGNKCISTNTYDNTSNYGGAVYSKGNFRIVTGTLYGSNEGNLSNTVTGARDNSGAALYTNSNTQRGTFSIPGDITSTWNSAGTLSTTNSTINVVNGALQ